MTEAAETTAPVPETPVWRKRLRALLPIVFMLGAFLLLASMVDLRAAFAGMGTADPALVGVALAILLTAPVIVGIKIRLLMIGIGRERGLWRCTRAVLASLTLNLVIPGRGGDLARALFLMDEGDQLGEFAGVVIVERLIDLIALASLVGLSALVFGANYGSWLGLAAAGAGLAGLLVASQGRRAPFFRELATKLSSSAERMLPRPGLLLMTALFSMLGWLANCVQLVVVLASVGVVWRESVGAVAAAVLTGVLPISIAGIGTRDAALVALIDGPPAELVAAGALLYSAIYFVLPILGGATLFGQFAHVRAILRKQNDR